MTKNSYEVDFLLQEGVKLVPFEVKSSARKKHDSMDAFCKKYSNRIKGAYLLSQKDVRDDDDLMCRPLYMLPFILEELLD